jgi:phospholipid transport system transporter-binding protein
VISWLQTDKKNASLTGALTQSSVSSLMPLAKRLQPLESDVNVELSELSHVDSAGLALLIELKSAGDKQGKTVTFSGTPPALKKLIALYNAATLLE